MQNRKIWIGIACIFLVICLSLGFSMMRENTKSEMAVEEPSKEVLNSGENNTEESIKTVESKDDSQNFKEDISANNKEKLNSSEEETTNNSPEENVIDNGLEKHNENEDSNNSSLVQDTVEVKSDVKLDEFYTEPVPEGKPLPVEWDDIKVQTDNELKCILSVDCSTLLNNLDKLNEEKKEIVPEDGVIFSKQEVTFYEGETVFNVLLREMKKNKIHMEYSMTPLYNSNFIEGIANLYEFDCGELSGWTYKVNGWSPNYGCSRYKLSDGDIVEWNYTCDLGRDVDSEFVNTELGE